MKTIYSLLCLAFLLSLATTGCGGGSSEPAAPTYQPTEPQHQAMFQPLPKVMASESNPITEAKVTLGRMLYYDTRFSKGGDISCNTCHLLDEFGADGNDTSPGHDGQFGARNSPTVYNAAAQFAQFWDGREPDVEAQAKGPVLNPVEMAMADADDVNRVLKDIPGYAPLFAAAFPDAKDPVNFDNMALAIGAFERGLVTPAKFDFYLQGNGAKLSAEERAGVTTFIEAGCSTCHMGPLLGGNIFQKMGLIKPYETTDKGRGDLTGNEIDNYFFKVPILRNIAETGPYLHDGSVDSLENTVRLMSEHQLAKPLTDAQVASIMTFLAALTGEIPTEYIAMPELP